MAKTLTVARMMAVAMGEGWAVVVIPHGPRFCVRVWDRDRLQYVDGVHGTFGPALRLAIRRAFQAQAWQEREPEPEQERERPGAMALPTPELLATVLQTASAVVA